MRARGAQFSTYEREEARIAAKSARMEALKPRIFNAKKRIMGMDLDALAKQIEEKKARKLAEKEEAAAYRDQYSTWVDRAAEMEREAIAKKNARLQAILDGQDKRAAALVEVQKNARSLDVEAAKISGVGPEDGNGEGMLFLGEDVHKKEREKMQRQQQAEWSKQQMLEHELRRELEKREAAEDDAYRAKLDELAGQLEKQCRMNKQMQLREMMDANARAAQLRKEAEKLKRAREAAAEQAELEAVTNGDFLCESFAATIRADDPNRFVPYNFKGLSQEQRQKILDEQLAQIAAREAARELEREQLAKEEDDRQRMLRQASAAHQRELNARAEMRRRDLEANLAKMQSDKERQEFMDKYIFTNEITDDFWKQFGTSAR